MLECINDKLMYKLKIFLFVLISIIRVQHVFAQEANLAVGTYTEKGSKGIYLFHFDTSTGKAVELSHTENTINPSFLAITKDKKYLYTVNETKEGKLTAFSLLNNKLNFINQVSTKGADPCYVSISPNQKYIFVGNYSGGSIAQFYRFADGRLSNVRQFIQHPPNAHIHGTFFSPDGNYLITPDLGLNKVYIYPYSNTKQAPLQTSTTNFIQSPNGSGPRHLSFSKNGKYLYLMEELSGNISVYSFEKGNAKHLQTVAAHPVNFYGKPASSDIHIAPNGQYLYASNRGSENNIIKIKILHNGLLAENSTQYFSTQGIQPRNFTISADGKWLLVANQGSNKIIVFKIDPTNGALIATDNSIPVSMPVCLVLF